MRIRVDGDVSARWREAIDHACTDLGAIPGSDPSARVHIVPVGRDLAIEVVLADGRFASRRLRSPDALRATLEALLVVPEPARAPHVAAASTIAEPNEPVWSRSDSRDEPPPPSPASAAPPAEQNVGVELGGGFGGRVAGHGYLSADLEGLAAIRVGSWLLGTVFRWDFLGDKSAPQVDVFEMQTVGAGLLVGRRLPLGFGSLDVGVSPRLVVETQTFETRAGEQSTSATDVRLGGFGRIAFGKSALRAIVGLDGELSPARLRRAVVLDPRLPPLPEWSAGLCAGLTWAAAP